MQKKEKIILGIGIGLALLGVGYFVVSKKKSTPSPTATPTLTDIQEIFNQLTNHGAYVGRIDLSTSAWTQNDLPYLNAWLRAAIAGTPTFSFDNKTYNTVGGKAKV